MRKQFKKIILERCKAACISNEYVGITGVYVYLWLIAVAMQARLLVITNNKVCRSEP
jgi:hypothetical protein